MDDYLSWIYLLGVKSISIFAVVFFLNLQRASEDGHGVIATLFMVHMAELSKKQMF